MHALHAKDNPLVLTVLGVSLWAQSNYFSRFRLDHWRPPSLDTLEVLPLGEGDCPRYWHLLLSDQLNLLQGYNNRSQVMVLTHKCWHAPLPTPLVKHWEPQKCYKNIRTHSKEFTETLNITQNENIDRIELVFYLSQDLKNLHFTKIRGEHVNYILCIKTNMTKTCNININDLKLVYSPLWYVYHLPFAKTRRNHRIYHAPVWNYINLKIICTKKPTENI